MAQKNLFRRIRIIENTAIFKSFVVKIWLHNFDEYMKLFWDNIFKRKVATDWCVETYPDLFSKKMLEWKQQKS